MIRIKRCRCERCMSRAPRDRFVLEASRKAETKKLHLSETEVSRLRAALNRMRLRS